MANKNLGNVLMGRDLVFLSPGTAKNDVYIVSLSALLNTWNNFNPVFTHVQSSVQLIK
ncbi:MAG TPA: hypothetical protein VMW41_05655 [Candidatus Bathyarchaeia archaeon]|nr:hypothetical protein [Candidatus Bathyarchaeia archaeon]